MATRTGRIGVKARAGALVVKSAMNKALDRLQVALAAPISTGGVYTGTFEGAKKLVQGDKEAANTMGRVNVFSRDRWMDKAQVIVSDRRGIYVRV